MDLKMEMDQGRAKLMGIMDNYGSEGNGAQDTEDGVQPYRK
jgi:hypothetical protein